MNDLLPGLRDQLVAAAHRQHRRRTLQRRVATVAVGAAAAVVVAFAVLSVTTTEPAAAGIEITIVGDHYQVELTEIETRPGFIQDALRDAGIDATVEAVPVGPSLVGRFVGGSMGLPDAVQPFNSLGSTFSGFRIPLDYNQPIRLQIGRPAESGETYAAAGDAYSPGEPLSCLGVYGARLAEAAALVPDNVEVRVQPMRDGAPDGPTASLEQISKDEVLSGLRAIDAIALAPDDVLLYASLDGQSPFLTPLSPDRGACRE